MESLLDRKEAETLKKKGIATERPGLTAAIPLRRAG
jgi:hypothetical protein